MKKLLTLFICCLFPLFLQNTSLIAQQKADTTYTPIVKNPVYETGEGPVIFIDEAHYNFHTLDGRYKAFAQLLGKDGYKMLPFTKLFTKKELEKGKILVISNALHKDNTERWSLPTPSAFSKEEINAVNDWVKNGGSLFLIADHMPMPGAAADLAASFGFTFYNGYAVDTTKRGSDTFDLEKGTLLSGTITDGRNDAEKIDSVTSFTGQGFEIPPNAQPMLMFNSHFMMFMTEEAGRITEETRRISAAGFFQGAFMEYGKGRLVVFGEAAMFTAQTGGGRIFGMGSPEAPQNEQFLLNIIHWLDGLIQ